MIARGQPEETFCLLEVLFRISTNQSISSIPTSIQSASPYKRAKKKDKLLEFVLISSPNHQEPIINQIKPYEQIEKIKENESNINNNNLNDNSSSYKNTNSNLRSNSNHSKTVLSTPKENFTTLRTSSPTQNNTIARTTTPSTTTTNNNNNNRNNNNSNSNNSNNSNNQTKKTKTNHKDNQRHIKFGENQTHIIKSHQNDDGYELEEQLRLAHKNLEEQQKISNKLKEQNIPQSSNSASSHWKNYLDSSGRSFKNEQEELAKEYEHEYFTENNNNNNYDDNDDDENENDPNYNYYNQNDVELVYGKPPNNRPIDSSVSSSQRMVIMKWLKSLNLSPRPPSFDPCTGQATQIKQGENNQVIDFEDDWINGVLLSQLAALLSHGNRNEVKEVYIIHFMNTISNINLFIKYNQFFFFLSSC